MSNEKYAVGQKMYSIIRSDEIAEYQIVRVGRKYLTVAQVDEKRQVSYDVRQFYVEDLYERAEMGTPQILFASREEAQEYLDRKRIAFKLFHHFGDYYASLTRYSADALRKIEKIVDEEEERLENADKS